MFAKRGHFTHGVRADRRVRQIETHMLSLGQMPTFYYTPNGGFNKRFAWEAEVCFWSSAATRIIVCAGGFRCKADTGYERQVACLPQIATNC